MNTRDRPDAKRRRRTRIAAAISAIAETEDWAGYVMSYRAVSVARWDGPVLEVCEVELPEAIVIDEVS